MEKTNEIIIELKRSYAIALETAQNYLANSIELDDAPGEEVKRSLEEEITAELKRARRLAKRIKVLGGRVPGSLELPRDQNFLQPPLDRANATTVIRGAIRANELAIAQYQKIIKLADGLDYVTQDMVIDLLSDKQEQRRRLLVFLAEREEG